MQSFAVFTNHACDHKPIFQGIDALPPYTSENWETWNPVSDRIRSELNHLVIISRDVKQGEMITEDYTRFDGFSGRDEEHDWIHSEFEEEMKEWCGDDYVLGETP
jgi:hypothetical protein